MSALPTVLFCLATLLLSCHCRAAELEKLVKEEAPGASFVVNPDKASRERQTGFVWVVLSARQMFDASCGQQGCNTATVT